MLGVLREWLRLVTRSIYRPPQSSICYPLELLAAGVPDMPGGHQTPGPDTPNGQIPMAKKLVVAQKWV